MADRELNLIYRSTTPMRELGESAAQVMCGDAFIL
jgi:hypothetical protein